MVEIGKIILNEVLELILILYFSYYILQGEATNKKWKFAVSFLGLLITVLLVNYLKQLDAGIIIVFCLDFFILVLCFKDKLRKKIVFFIVANFLNCLIQEFFTSIIFLCTDIKLKSLWYDNALTLLVRLLNFITLIIAYEIVKRVRKKYCSINKGIPWLYLVVFCIAVFCCDLMIVQVEMGFLENGNNIGNKITLLGTVLVGVFFVIGSVAFALTDSARNHYVKENELKGRYLKMQECYYKKLYENESKVKGLRHDMKAHISCLKTLSDDGKYQELKEYIGQLDIETKTVTEGKINCGNYIVNAVLNEMSAVAAEHNTDFEFQGRIPQSIKLNLMDLCTLFFNIVSNAEEACRDYVGEFEKEIQVTVTNYKSNLYIMVTNPIMQKVNMKMLGKSTKKRDKELHGFGIRNILDVVERYNGRIEFKEVEGKFVVEVLFFDII